MNIGETARLLAVAAGFDNRHADDLQTAAWHELLRDYAFDQCRAAILAHYRDPETRHRYLTAPHVLDRLEVQERGKRDQVEGDVRSAKARGLIEPDWPAREPLPRDVAALLARAREADNRAAERATTQALTT